MRFLDNIQKEKIGYNYVIEKLHILSPYGRDKLRYLKPYVSKEEGKLALEHEKIEKTRKAIEDKKFLSKIELLLMKLKDVRNTFNHCREERILDEVELYEMKVQCMIIEDIRELLTECPLPLLITELKDIINILDPNEDGLPTYHIYSSYSPELMKIREKKKRLEEMIYLEKSRERVDELRGERLLVVVEEGKEELEVRKKLSVSLAGLMTGLLKNIEVVGELDLLIAKSRLCNRYNLTKPFILDRNEGGDGNTNKVSGKNFINLQIKDMVEGMKKDYSPIDITLTNGTSIITGANMGGKTVALKTITLNVFLFQMGFYPFATDVTMPLFDFIDFISDDMQDISKGLSTFGAEMMKLKEIMIFLYKGTGFIALDEFARGTNPYEGQKIAKSLSEYLNKFDSISLMATHYDGVVTEDMTHYQVVGLRDVDFDSLKRKIDLNKKDSIGILQKYMNYTLERCDGYEAPRDALNITILLGIQKDFTDHILKNYKGEG